MFVYSTCIICGTLLIALGGSLAAYGWNLKSSRDRRQSEHGPTATPIKRTGLRRVIVALIGNAYSLAIFGSLIMTGGGLLATYGWNLRSSQIIWEMLIRDRTAQRDERRHAVIWSVAAEWCRNMSIISNKPYCGEKPEELTKYAHYPTLHAAEVSNALTCGLFSGDDDRDLFYKMYGVHELLTEFNNKLAISEDVMRRSDAKGIADFRQQISEGPFLKHVKRDLVQLGRLLVEKYGIKESDTFMTPSAPPQEQK